jgi:phage terminase small subunit
MGVGATQQSGTRMRKRKARKAPPPQKLSLRYQRFVAEYLIDGNGTRSAIAAGFAKIGAHVTASRLLRYPKIQAAMAEAREKLTKKYDLSRERIATELAKCGYANMEDYYRKTKDGDPYLDWSNLTRDQAAALSEVTVEDFIDGRGKEARAVKRVKFRMVDKRAALDSLARLQGYVRNRFEVTGREGEELQFVKIYIPDNQRSRRRA